MTATTVATSSHPLASGGVVHKVRIEDVVRLSDALSPSRVKGDTPRHMAEWAARVPWDATYFGVGAIVGDAMTGTGAGVLFGGAVGYAVGRSHWSKRQR